MVPAPQQIEIPGLDFFGDGGLSAAFLDPFFEIARMAPFFNIFVSNGEDGTATSPDGGNAGILAGNGGDGFNAHRTWG